MEHFFKYSRRYARLIRDGVRVYAVLVNITAYPRVYLQASPSFNKEFLDLMIVPLVGYDANCYRLGYGGGYYDRYLKDFNAPTIGLAYSFQYIEHYQSEDFDIPLNDIITDKKI